MKLPPKGSKYRRQADRIKRNKKYSITSMSPGEVQLALTARDDITDRLLLQAARFPEAETTPLQADPMHGLLVHPEASLFGKSVGEKLLYSSADRRGVSRVVRSERITGPKGSTERIVVEGKRQRRPKINKGPRRRGSVERAEVDWARLRGCDPRKRCDATYCARCGVTPRLKAVAPRCAVLPRLAERSGMSIALLTLTSRPTRSWLGAQRRRLGATAVLSGLLGGAGRWVAETKTKSGSGPSCCSDRLCMLCRGTGHMPAQHLHAHGVAVVPNHWDWKLMHRIVPLYSGWTGWLNINVKKVLPADTADVAGYLAAYASKSGDPWQWATLRSLLGARWGESWGALRGAERTVSIQRRTGTRVRVHHLDESAIADSPWLDHESGVNDRDLCAVLHNRMMKKKKEVTRALKRSREHLGRSPELAEELAAAVADARATDDTSFARDQLLELIEERESK